MLRSTARRLTAAKLDPLTRAQMDMFSAHVLSDSSPSSLSSFSPLEKSNAAKTGETMRGDVVLPVELKQAVKSAISVLEDKSVIRTRALELYEYLRNSATQSGFASTKAPIYDELGSLAFLTGVMPAMYAATLNVLTMARSRLDGWTPDKVIDYGSGTGSAAWAVNEVWPGGSTDPIRYVGLESSQALADLSNALFQALPLNEQGHTMAKAHILPVNVPQTTLSKLQIAPKQNDRTIALSSFALGSISTREKRREAVRAMWESGSPVMIVIERGTPAGSRLVLEAREQLLAYGRRDDSDGSHVVAPCPHDGECPLHRNVYAYCHFSQRLQTPSFLRQTKATTKGENDSKFSYVIIRRGARPSLEKEAALDTANDQLPIDPKRTDLSSFVSSHNSSAWPRIISPPRKASRHVILEVCSGSNETIERHTIPKSQGRQAYYDARKAAWGDAFPHAPKNGPQLAPAIRKAKADELAGVVRDEVQVMNAAGLSTQPRGGDAVRLTNKFAGSSERRAKKAERRKSAGWRSELERMDPSNEHSLSRRRKPREVDPAPRNSNSGIITEYEVEF